MLVTKNGKRHITEGIKLPNREKIRNKEIYKYLEILEADTTKQMKERNLRKENQKATQDKIILQEPYQRNKYLGCPSRQIFRTILEVD